jgi:hypothetical protein
MTPLWRKVVLAAFLMMLPVSASAQGLTDAQVRSQIIQESIAKYPESCPCPYSIDRSGHKCGRRSAYSRPGGWSPYCYASDVHASMIHEYRITHGG